MLTKTRRTAELGDNQRRVDMARAISSCESCMLRWHGRGPVIPSGPTPNDVMVLVDQPPRQDDIARKVTHQGPASRLLRSSLRTAGGLSLDEVFLAHLVSCWSRDRLTKEFMAACHKNLKRQVEACDPRAVLVLGAVAMGAVADRKMTLKRDHGRMFKPAAGPLIDRWCMVTWHPAAFKEDGRDLHNINNFNADIATFGRFVRERSWE